MGWNATDCIGGIPLPDSAEICSEYVAGNLISEKEL